MTIPMFWDIMPCSLLKVNRHFGRTSHLHLQGRRICQARNQHKAGSKQSLAYSSTLKVEATWYSEISVDFQRTTRRYIPEDKTLHEKDGTASSNTAVPWLFVYMFLWYGACH
jgi:hypothetical protein